MRKINYVFAYQVIARLFCCGINAALSPVGVHPVASVNLKNYDQIKAALQLRN